MQIITLTSDMGLKDYYVAVVKAFILQNCKDFIHIIDITHDITPFKTAEAAYQISQSYKSFPDGTIHVIGVEAEPYISSRDNTEFFPSVLVMDNQYFISSDNGIFGVLTRQATDYEFYRIDDIMSNPANFKFAFKNMLAATACKIANGEKLDTFCTKHSRPNQLFYPEPVTNVNYIQGEIMHFDSYGNAITNIDLRTFNTIGKNETFVIAVKSEIERNKFNVISNTFNDVTPGEKLALFTENGYLMLAINKGANKSNGGIQSLFGLSLNEPVVIKFSPPDSSNSIESMNTFF